jgi:hypothetical protein
MCKNFIKQINHNKVTNDPTKNQQLEIPYFLPSPLATMAAAHFQVEVVPKTKYNPKSFKKINKKNSQLEKNIQLEIFSYPLKSLV